jgi:hypothetical protein
LFRRASLARSNVWLKLVGLLRAIVDICSICISLHREMAGLWRNLSDVPWTMVRTRVIVVNIPLFWFNDRNFVNDRSRVQDRSVASMTNKMSQFENQ